MTDCWGSLLITFSTSVFLLLSIWSVPAMCVDVPCRARPGDQGQGQVCVCDSSNCDTIERPTRLPPGQYHWYSTSNSTPGFSHTVGNFSQGLADQEDVIVFTVNSSVQFQQIIGFGGSFTDSVGIVLNSLPEDAQDKLIESYFGTSGIEYTQGRVPIGGSDFSPRRYTLDDVPDDYDLQHFSLTDEDYLYKIPVIKRAFSASDRGLKVYGCAWNAPSWMKTNNDYISGYVVAEQLHTWAKYHIKFLEAYKNEGVSVWAISGGNEALAPFFFTGIVGTLMGTLLTAPIQRYWLKDHLMPLLQENNLSDVKFLALDDQRIFAPYWMDRLAADPEAYQSVEGVALHWYSDWLSPSTILDYLHYNFPNKLILYTESSINYYLFDGKPVELGSWDRGAAYIYNIMENINHWTNGYIDWNLVLDTDGGPFLNIPLDAAIIVNRSSGEFYKQPMYYGLGHFSKFVPPGSTRVQVNSNQEELIYINSSNATWKPQHYPNYLERYNYTASEEDDNDPRHKQSHIKFDPPKVTVPPVVLCLATNNSDESHTVIVFNSKNVTARVMIKDTVAGFISLDIEAHSINSFVCWLS